MAFWLDRLTHLRTSWLDPVFSLRRLHLSLSLYRQYMRDWQRYRALPLAEELRFIDSFPQIYDRRRTTPINRQYLFQALWAFEKIQALQPKLHVDVGSEIPFVASLTALTQVAFIDIRPAVIKWRNFTPLNSSILSLPFASRSVHSLSCLHVVEHIGLGRYGDPLDPQGTVKAIKELCRVVAHDGNLFFSTPIGKPRVCFNAHRIHHPLKILELFSQLELVEFSAIDDADQFVKNHQPEDFSQANYSCGLFWFKRTQ